MSNTTAGARGWRRAGGLSAFVAPRWRTPAWLALLAVITAAFSPALVELARYSLDHDLHSHVLLVPAVSGYVLWLRWNALPRRSGPCWGGVAVASMAGVGLLLADLWLPAESLSHNDHLSLMALALAAFWAAAGWLMMGRRWMRAAAFPHLFLVFMAPMPDALLAWAESLSQAGSAMTAGWFFEAAGVPHLREGLVFRLPGISLEVAEECSGIRSSWVLLMTTLLAGHLLLRGGWHRLLVALLVVPIGLLRNGLRIMVIGLLCVEQGPQVVEGTLHRRGGPLFFILSLLPLFLVLWWLHRREAAHSHHRAARSTAGQP